MRDMPSPDVRDAARLLFVVPPDVFDSFPCQPWQPVKGTEMRSVPAALQKLQQWVMELQVQPSPRSSSDGSGSCGPISGRNTGGDAHPGLPLQQQRHKVLGFKNRCRASFVVQQLEHAAAL